MDKTLNKLKFVLFFAVLSYAILMLVMFAGKGGDTLEAFAAAGPEDDGLGIYAQYCTIGGIGSSPQANAYLTSLANYRNLQSRGVSADSLEAARADIESVSADFHSYLFSPSGKRAQDLDLISKLWIDGMRCGIDNKSGSIYFTTGKDKNSISGSLRPESATYKGEKVPVFAQIFDADGVQIVFPFTPEQNKPYILRAYSKIFEYDYKLIFTVMPLVQIDSGSIGDEYGECTISLTDPDFRYTPDGTDYNYIENSALIHLRGGFARSFPKKSYTVKFTRDDGENKDFPLLGMRNDSDWILDAMYIDMARMRNRLTADIWNDMGSPLYYSDYTDKKITNGTHGEFCEVFLNNRYAGLYCLTEKIDRKQLRLLKETGDGVFRSMIFKGYTWDNALMGWGYERLRPNMREWGGLEQQFPRIEKQGDANFGPMYDFWSFTYDATDDEFKSGIGSMIDIRNFADYMLLIAYNYAYDNSGKNVYFSVYDLTVPGLDKIFITPWDMDATWGRSWESSFMRYNLEWMDQRSKFLLRLVDLNPDGITDLMVRRWNELKTGVFSPDSIMARVNTYFDYFDNSGAWEREAGRWKEYELDLEFERAYLDKWIHQRYEYLDKFINEEIYEVETPLVNDNVY